MKKLFFVSIVLLFIVGCAPRVALDIKTTQPPLSYNMEVVVIGLKEVVPESAQYIGTVKVGDSGFTVDCDYPIIIEKAEIEARKSGGNLLKITSHKTPGIMSTCHQITADIYHVEDLTLLGEMAEESAFFDSTANYAMLHVYRTGSAGAFISYKVHLGDRELVPVKHNSEQSIMILQEGPNEIWAQTESRTAIPINVEFGRDYYLRCGITMGLLVGRPSLTLVDKSTGKMEIEALRAKK